MSKKNKYDYEKQLEFAKYIGFKTPVLAMNAIGKDEFKKRLRLYSEEDFFKPAKVNIPKENMTIPIKITKVGLFQAKYKAKKEKAESEMLSQGGKKLYFDENYILFPDGRLYSLNFYRFLKPQPKKNKYGNVFYQYSLRNRDRYIIARLVYLHFGNHSKKEYGEIDCITYKDKNAENYNIDNLEEVTQKELNQRQDSKFTGRDTADIAEQNSRIKAKHKDNIQQLIKMGYSKFAIGRLYNVSEPSVTRFLTRHGLIK